MHKFILIFIILFLNNKSLPKNEKINIKKSKESIVEWVYPKGWPWRGITIVTQSDREYVSEEKLKKLSNEGLNLIRLRISVREFARNHKLTIEESKSNSYNWSKDLIQICRKLNINILISVSDFPYDYIKGFKQMDSKFWESDDELSMALAEIENLVMVFDVFDNVLGYEFFAEPLISVNNTSESPPQWPYFFDRICRLVRNKSNKHIVYTPGPGGLPTGYELLNLPTNDPKIIYNFHFYLPHKYTHQGIKGRNQWYSYPGYLEFRKIDINFMRAHMGKVKKWSTENGDPPIFVGEFSVVRWAEGKEKYLKDLLESIEEYQFGWAYFSLNGWNGWDYNFEPIGPQSKNLIQSISETNTENILKKYWNLNLLDEK